VTAPEQPVFFYDLGSPQCYVVAETIMATLPVVPEWQPVFGSELSAANPAQLDRDQIEEQAAELGLQPIRWPAIWPADTHQAMLAATYAKQIGRAVAFSLAAFRQTFAGGRDLGDEDTILIAGAACEMHPTALRKGIELRSTQRALANATRRARTAGVTALPAIQIKDRIYPTVEEAAAAIEGALRG
jgi:predicted DsbA family dithiol-disulfide isomerase